jgi:hypothetical protein
MVLINGFIALDAEMPRHAPTPNLRAAAFGTKAYKDEKFRDHV